MSIVRDKFFKEDNCQRCGRKLHVRTMSWFTTETICMQCSDEEEVIKDHLRKNGDPSAGEGCGFIPSINRGQEDGSGKFEETGKDIIERTFVPPQGEHGSDGGRPRG